MWSASPATPSTGAGAAPNKTSTATAAAPPTLYRARRVLHTGTDLLTDKQRARLDALFGPDEHVEVEATWTIYQAMIAAYRAPDRIKGRHLMARLIASVSHNVPAALSEVVTLGRTLTKRAGDILAYFDRPGTSNGPTEEIQRPARAPPRHRPRLPEPHQLHRQITTRDRRLQTPTTPSIVMSHIIQAYRRGRSWRTAGRWSSPCRSSADASP